MLIYTEAINYASKALAEAQDKNDHAKSLAHLIHENDYTARLLELFLGDNCPKRPKNIDTFSYLCGASQAIAATIRTGGTAWLEDEPQAHTEGPTQ